MRGHLPSFDVEVIKRNKKIWRIIVQHRRNLAFDWARSHGESWWLAEGFVRPGWTTPAPVEPIEPDAPKWESFPPS
jgi:hypothetical protein